MVFSDVVGQVWVICGPHEHLMCPHGDVSLTKLDQCRVKTKLHDKQIQRQFIQEKPIFLYFSTTVKPPGLLQATHPLQAMLTGEKVIT